MIYFLSNVNDLKSSEMPSRSLVCKLWISKLIPKKLVTIYDEKKGIATASIKGTDFSFISTSTGADALLLILQKTKNIWNLRQTAQLNLYKSTLDGIPIEWGRVIVGGLERGIVVILDFIPSQEFLYKMLGVAPHEKDEEFTSQDESEALLSCISHAFLV
jgi:hypothetical protein